MSDVLPGDIHVMETTVAVGTMYKGNRKTSTETDMLASNLYGVIKVNHHPLLLEATIDQYGYCREWDN